MRERRLTRSDWVRHGLRTLAREGPGALKVGPIAARLRVSRGSFYWHFEDIADFRAALLRTWEQNATDRIIRDLDARAGDPERLTQLMQGAFRGRRRLDRAMRAWAAHDGRAATVVAGVDSRRIARIAALLVEAGVEDERARQRAAFLYWAFLGQAAVMDPAHAALPPEAIADLARLFEA